MAANRPTTRRRSAKQAFDDDDAPAPKRPRAEVNGAGKRAAGETKKAAKAAYDEDDDGFQFSRRTSRRTTKAQAGPAPEPISEEPVAKSAREEPFPAKSTTRRKKTQPLPADPESSDTQKRRRSTRISGDKEQLEVRPKAPEPATTKRTKKSAPTEKERRKQITPAPEAQPEKSTALVGVKTPTHNELTVAKKRDPNAQRIMLPFADTPVITRNKEMRKGSKEGHRRSSTGLRGRRASSLIDSGMSNGESTKAAVQEMCTASKRSCVGIDAD
jgi:kinetochore protein Mis13/DSN1